MKFRRTDRLWWYIAEAIVKNKSHIVYLVWVYFSLPLFVHTIYTQFTAIFMFLCTHWCIKCLFGCQFKMPHWD